MSESPVKYGQANHEALRDRLIDLGRMQLSRPSKPVVFSGEQEDDILVGDLKGHPHAFVVACVMDRQMKAERVWRIPAEMRRRLGTFEFNDLCALSEQDLHKSMSKRPSVHRLRDIMPKLVHKALLRIRDVYHGDASAIWSGTPSSATIVRRFLEFEGVGPKIATMAANILVRDFRVPVSDRYSIDISVDTHVRRVMTRLGLVPDGASVEEIVYRARELSPEYPGIFDLAIWEIGRERCHPRRPPECSRCDLQGLCPSAGRLA